MVVMAEIRTLRTLQELRDSQFNQPPPRHGLRLLHWFVCKNRGGGLDPKSSAYGFHWFNNKNGGVNLLPAGNFHYYEVGNLNAEGAEGLPSYVRPDGRIYHGEHNKDRIIVRVKSGGAIDRVYVTEHDGGNNFSQDHTYCVDQSLLDQISNMTKDDFLSAMKQHQNEDSFWSRCTIL